jgi:hypothetical protein
MLPLGSKRANDQVNKTMKSTLMWLTVTAILLAARAPFWSGYRADGFGDCISTITEEWSYRARREELPVIHLLNEGTKKYGGVYK